MAAKKTTVNTEVENVVEEKPAAPVVKTGKVNAANGLNLRAEKSLESEIITVLANDAVVTVEGKISNGWAKITTADGRTGFVVSEYLAI